jgi:hypothetical protein
MVQKIEELAKSLSKYINTFSSLQNILEEN